MISEPIGSDVDVSIVPDRPKAGGLSPVEILIVLVITGLLFWIMSPSYFKARCSAQVTECKSNLKNMATALEMYAADNEKAYPANFDAICAGNGNYLKCMPTCPSKHNRIFVHDRSIELMYWKGPPAGPDYSYNVTFQPAAYSLHCLRNHDAAYKGFKSSPRNYPQYDSEKGLLDHPP